MSQQPFVRALQRPAEHVAGSEQAVDAVVVGNDPACQACIDVVAQGKFIREDYTEDLKKISVPVLAMNGDGDQVVPYATSDPRAVELVQNGTLKTYAGYPHGMPTTHADTINNDLLAFIQS